MGTLVEAYYNLVKNESGTKGSMISVLNQKLDVKKTKMTSGALDKKDGFWDQERHIPLKKLKCNKLTDAMIVRKAGKGRGETR